LCTVNTEHGAKQDEIITNGLYLAKFFSRKRPSAGNLRTVLMYSKNGIQWNPISFTLGLNFNVVFNWLADGRTRLNHVSKYNPIVIIASSLDIFCVLTARYI
jgi:hypothetical protein